MIWAELTKLKRSSTWVIAVLLPLVAITTGTLNLANNRDTIDAGWASFTSQVILFYSLLFYSLGIGLLAATVWRAEHRGGNWNSLITTTTRPLALVLAKIVAIATPVALMQVVLVVGTFISGTAVLRLPGEVPWNLALVGLIAMVAALPLIAIQSLLSMLFRSFAAPVAVCFLGCVLGVASVTSTALRPASNVVPQALNTRALNLGSAAIAESGGLTIADTMPILASALLGTAGAIVLALAAIRYIKLR